MKILEVRREKSPNDYSIAGYREPDNIYIIMDDGTYGNIYIHFDDDNIEDARKHFREEINSYVGKIDNFDEAFDMYLEVIGKTGHMEYNKCINKGVESISKNIDRRIIDTIFKTHYGNKNKQISGKTKKR